MNLELGLVKTVIVLSHLYIQMLILPKKDIVLAHRLPALDCRPAVVPGIDSSLRLVSRNA
eukprot:COSAG06_NODE_2986_length_5985_cov_9.841828_3_plen_60_part_00